MFKMTAAKPRDYILLLCIIIMLFPIGATMATGYWLLIVLLFGVLALFAVLSVISCLIEENRINGNTMKGIKLLYFYTFLLYALAYALAGVLSPQGGFIEGIYNICGCESYKDVTGGYMEVIMLSLGELPALLIESMAYSISVMTSLGDGELKPQNVYKLVVASQVGFTFYITIFGLASYFDNKSSEALVSVGNKIINKLESKEQSTSELKSVKLNKVRVFKRPVIALRGLMTGYFVE